MKIRGAHREPLLLVQAQIIKAASSHRGIVIEELRRWLIVAPKTEPITKMKAMMISDENLNLDKKKVQIEESKEMLPFKASSSSWLVKNFLDVSLENLDAMHISRT